MFIGLNEQKLMPFGGAECNVMVLVKMSSAPSERPGR